MNKKIIAACVITLTLIIGVAILAIEHNKKSLVSYVKSYQDMVYTIERDFVENIPIYRDFAKPRMEQELMKYSLKEQAAVAVKHGIKPLKNFDDINSAIKEGKLVSVDTGHDKLYYFHNVRREYRYLTPAAKEALELTTQRFQDKIQARKEGLPTVKPAVSSVIRTVDHQEKIFGRKFVSIHSYGACFDIFFEDYYVQLPVPETSKGPQEEIRRSMHSRTGFLLGDALREQFKTVLMETLLELQREGKIYVFFEDDNRCYHITVPAKL